MIIIITIINIVIVLLILEVISILSKGCEGVNCYECCDMYVPLPEYPEISLVYVHKNKRNATDNANTF